MSTNLLHFLRLFKFLCLFEYFKNRFRNFNLIFTHLARFSPQAVEE
jgi:hypothetical protein